MTVYTGKRHRLRKDSRISYIYTSGLPWHRDSLLQQPTTKKNKTSNKNGKTLKKRRMSYHINRFKYPAFINKVTTYYKEMGIILITKKWELI